MGCCASTTNKPSSVSNKPSSVSHNHRHSPAARSHSSHHSRAPPLPCLEEETVKEVLSETPTPKPSVPKIEDEEKKINTAKLALHKVQEEDDHSNVDKKPLRVTVEEISEVSEICSLSESVSTTTITEKREDDDGEVRQRVNRSPAKFRNRSHSGVLSGKRDGAVGRSPVRRSEPSPGRIRSISTKEGRVLKTDRQKMDSGDSSRRRPRSPATRPDNGGKRPGLGRTPSGRRSGNSPARVRSDFPERTRKMEETNKSPPTTNESLENPLVSLECFIFL